MSENLNTYFFLPWLRTGVANLLSNYENPVTTSRISVTAGFKAEITDIDGQKILLDPNPFSKEIYLTGPGDVTGIERNAIIKHEPRDWITNFESNYMPYIEFYDEDFPWRFTPIAPFEGATGKDRLVPWLTLVVLKEDEFDPVGDQANPLPFFNIQVPKEQIFPPSDTLWAWAHVHVNQAINDQNLPVFPDAATINVSDFLNKFSEELSKNPDMAYSRLLSSRKLESNTAYHAFLIPTYETGRLTGIGEKFDENNLPFGSIKHCAWDDYPGGSSPKPSPEKFPYFYRWYFRTGTVGDFEYLVRLLEPKKADSRLGKKNIDVLNPDWGLPPITGTPQNPEDTDLKGVLRLGGALEPPSLALNTEEIKIKTDYDHWDKNYPHEFQQKLANFINISDSYFNKTSNIANGDLDWEDFGPDPIITPPLYGGHHKKISRLLYAREDNSHASPTFDNSQNWLHQLNLDPRHRTAAGFGAEVIRKHQEEYMKSAWEQIGDILAANRKIRQGQLAAQVSRTWYDRHIVLLKEKTVNKALWLLAPLSRRVTINGITAFGKIKKSFLPYSVLSAPFRRILRPRGSVIKRITKIYKNKFPNISLKVENLISLINSQEVVTAPPKLVPDKLPTLGNISDSLMPNLPIWFIKLAGSQKWLKYLLLGAGIILVLLIILLSISTILRVIIGSITSALFVIFIWLLNLETRISRVSVIEENNRSPDFIPSMPSYQDFVISTPDHNVIPQRTGRPESSELKLFKKALSDAYDMIEASKDTTVNLSANIKNETLDIPVMINAILHRIDPLKTIPLHVLQQFNIPDFTRLPRLKSRVLEDFQEIMAYPVFDIPMYKPLYELSAEKFMPNINKIEQNSITLLSTYQEFIESYLVGVNFEFNKELLWQGFPCDLMGTSFRQFWDVGAMMVDPENPDKTKDIPEIHRWSLTSKLGQHDNRQSDPTQNKSEMVLVIRGELLKKYPTAVVYAQRADWVYHEGTNEIDLSQPRVLVEVRDDEIQTGNRDNIKYPLYEAKIEPDIYFFGFDLTDDEVKGDPGENPGDKAGWFFIIKERPGEPRFGSDIQQEVSASIDSWSDLLSSHLSTVNGFLTPTVPDVTFSHYAVSNDTTDPFEIQHREDSSVVWDSDVSSAELAYIFYQLPVMIAVHGSEMLGKTMEG